MEHSILYNKAGIKPLFSFIIPTYNRNELLVRAIKSIFDLNLIINYAIIIVDNNSSNEITNLNIKYLNEMKISKICTIQYYFFHTNNGMYNNWNNGIRLCTTNYYTILNDDDILLSDFSKLLEYALKYKPVEILCGSIQYWNGSEKIMFKKRGTIKNLFFNFLNKCNYNKKYPQKRVLDGNPIPGTLGAIFNKKSIEKIGYYNPNFGLAADYDFNTKCLIEIGIRRFYFTVAYYYISENESSKISTTRKFIEESFEIRSNILNRLSKNKCVIKNILLIKQSLYVYEHSKLFNFDILNYTKLVNEYKLIQLNKIKYYYFKLIYINLKNFL